uniref:Uncharacterized protein n=1 Tax=Anopheles darlingi TaxID=43151 RepID=A0A2M4D6Z6_ANODA
MLWRLWLRLLLRLLLLLRWLGIVTLLVQQLVHLGVGWRVHALVLLEVHTKDTSSKHLRLGGQRFGDGLIAVHAHRGVVLVVDDALDLSIVTVNSSERLGGIVVSTANRFQLLRSGGQRRSGDGRHIARQRRRRRR